MKEPKKQSPALGTSAPGVDFGELERVLVLMQEYGLEEFEYAVGDLHIRLKKPTTAMPAGQGRAIQFSPEATTAVASQHTPVAMPAVVPPSSPEPPPAPAPPTEELHIIKSPIVGTFYSAPNPDAAPYVKVGDSVQAGQTICIIEAMKLMNEIEADIGGEIVRALIENGQPVEYGEPLFELRPAKKKK